MCAIIEYNHGLDKVLLKRGVMARIPAEVRALLTLTLSTFPLTEDSLTMSTEYALFLLTRLIPLLK